ncbi:MAG: 4,5-DOPA-extradiol-dioxygenase [Promethearchaeota archaeon]|jgi:4,5-DOPA dioxygenase extradiol
MSISENSTEKMPVLFVGHGSPMNIISDNEFTRDLIKLGKILPKPKGILVVSAHWLTGGTKVLCSQTPRTIYDFYGFPEQLYAIDYPAQGLPELAKIISKRLEAYDVKCDYHWGYDHASWAILKHIYPDADIPLIELSLDYGFNSWNLKSIEYHYKIARNLAFLREEGVLIIGSGNIVHNLGIFDIQVNAPIMSWAKELDESVKQNLLTQNHENLINFKKLGDSAHIGIPTWDHYLPMIYTIALQEKNETLKFVHEGFQHGSISMRCFQIG